MTYLIIRHRVADFAKWKPEYDAHAPARDAAGLVERELLHEVGEPNHVALLFEVTNLEKAKDLVVSDSIRNAMQKAGVTEKPDIYFLER
jgi:hypothetical protein